MSERHLENAVTISHTVANVRGLQRTVIDLGIIGGEQGIRCFDPGLRGALGCMQQQGLRTPGQRFISEVPKIAA